MRLKPVTAQDYEMLYSLEHSPDLLMTGRLAGHTPSPEEYVSSLHTGVLAQFIVVSVADGQPLGLVSSYGANFPNQYAYISMWKANNGSTGDTRFMQGMALFLDYLFARWPFRKLYGETADYNLRQFASGLGGLFQEEGRLKGHVFLNGEYWDKVIVALYRTEWESRRDRVMNFVRPVEAD